MSCIKINRILQAVLILLIFLIPTKKIFAQGSIFGAVSNSDASVPANEDIRLFGYLENRDEEIRIENCIGTGYDNSFWFDHLPNYLTETPGDPFSYHFFNITNNENFILSATIDNGSFQQEDITLSLFSLPQKPADLTGHPISGPAVELSWTIAVDVTYHIYRRDASSDGSFFRIDDPSGNLTNPGVANAPYIDNAVDGVNFYDYIIISENPSGDLGPHSEIITLSSQSFICGDVDNSGFINILDIVYLITFKYKGGPAPVYMASAEVNNDGLLNILDVVTLINFKYKGGADLNCPDEFVYP